MDEKAQWPSLETRSFEISLSLEGQMFVNVFHQWQTGELTQPPTIPCGLASQSVLGTLCGAGWRWDLSSYKPKICYPAHSMRTSTCQRSTHFKKCTSLHHLYLNNFFSNLKPYFCKKSFVWFVFLLWNYTKTTHMRNLFFFSGRCPAYFNDCIWL